MAEKYKDGDRVQRNRPDGSKEYFVFSESLQSWLPQEQYLELFPKLPADFGTKERSFGLAQRAAIQGLAQGPLSLPALAGDVVFGAIPAFVTQAFGGKPYTAEQLMPFTSSMQYGGEKLADILNKPRPVTPEEQRLVNLGSAAYGAGASAGVMKLLKSVIPVSPSVTTPSTPAMAQRFRDIATEAAVAPKTQAAAATGAVAGADILPRFVPGESPGVKEAFGLAGGVLGGLAGGTTAGLTKSISSLVTQPFTRGGREMNVGALMRQMALNPEQSIFEMEQYKPVVPGVRPLTAEASKDIGLAGAETPIRSAVDISSRIAEQRLENMRILRREMDRLARTSDPAERDAIIQKMQEVRDQMTAPMRNAAFADMDQRIPPAQARQSIQLVLGAQLDNIATSERGAGEGADAVLRWTRNRLESGILDPKVQGDYFRRLYEIRKDLRAKTVAPTIDETSRTFKSGAPVAEDIIRAIDDILDSAAGGNNSWKSYLENFALASRRQERVGLLQDVQQASMGSVADVGTGTFMLSAPKLAGAIRSRQSEINETLTSVQQKRLNNILRDLQANAAAGAPGAKPLNSSTVKNITMAALIGRALGGNAFESPIVRTIFKPLEWLSSIPEERARDLLVDAMLDPKLGALLMKKASPENIITLGDMMRESYRATLYATPSAGLLSGSPEEQLRRQQANR